ncbi:MAG: tetratricopeptide repeat protein [Armatimonadota bacterium]
MPTDTASLVARWRRADQNAVFADNERSASFFLRLARDYPDHFIGQLALLEGARWQHRVGLDDGPEGTDALLRLLKERSPWLRTDALRGLAELDLSRGEYAQARLRYEGLAGEGPAEAQTWAQFRLAELGEFDGDWTKAAEGFKSCASSPDKALAAEAGYALKRVQALQQAQPQKTAAAGRAVRYLGEDRETQGDWYTRYGHEAFILCAQQAPQDVAGGALDGWKVVPSVGNPNEKTRYWVTDASEDNGCYLYNPLAKVRRAANWDDRGEAYPVGTGPDLLLDVPVPPGEHIVSLYFVNDRNYYEPSRVYTVSVFDETGRYQTGAEVRSAIRGTYYRFSATGPTLLKFRLWRNLAVNLIFAGIFLDKPGPSPAWPEQVKLWAPHQTTVTLPAPTPSPTQARVRATGGGDLTFSR